MVVREAALPKAEPRPDRIRGVLVDEGGQPIRGRVALVWARGSMSSMTGSDGRFELALPRDVDVVLHGSAAESLVGVLTEVAGAAEVTLPLALGATLHITLRGGERHRCAIFHGGARIEDFGLRPDETNKVVVPAGDVRVLVYDGADALGDRALTLERGASESVVFELEE